MKPRIRIGLSDDLIALQGAVRTLLDALNAEQVRDVEITPFTIPANTPKGYRVYYLAVVLYTQEDDLDLELATDEAASSLLDMTGEALQPRGYL